MDNFQALFKTISQLKVAIIGDVMLDTYIWGNVERISPEAPVPIVSLDSKEQRLGGAGNVALNVHSLGATPYLLSVIGDDDDGAILANLFEEKNIPNTYLLKSKTRITTNKTRVISRNQQILRLDSEIINDLNKEDEERLIETFEEFVRVHKPDVVILQDYNKGVLTEAVIKCVISICRKEGIITAVDPKRKNFFEFKGVDLFKPNLKEVKDALNMFMGDVKLSVLEMMHAEMQNILHHKVSLITLSEKGVFYQNSSQAMIIPSHLRNISDVSGAGDTVIAVAALVYAASKSVHLMAEVSNIAGGLVCEEVGTVGINKEKLLHECELLLV